MTAHLERSKRRDVIDADPNSVRKIASFAISNLEAANDCSRTLIGGPVVRGTVNVPIAGLLQQMERVTPPSSGGTQRA